MVSWIAGMSWGREKPKCEISDGSVKINGIRMRDGDIITFINRNLIVRQAEFALEYIKTTEIAIVAGISDSMWNGPITMMTHWQMH